MVDNITRRGSPMSLEELFSEREASYVLCPISFNATEIAE